MMAVYAGQLIFLCQTRQINAANDVASDVSIVVYSKIKNNKLILRKEFFCFEISYSKVGR